MHTVWEHRYAQRCKTMKSSVIREILKLTEYPDIISFAGGMPASEIFPIEEILNGCIVTLRDYGQKALQYSTTEGHAPLRELLCNYCECVGIHSTPENTLITAGSQQALDLIGKIFINPGDKILVESPTYLGALQAWDVFGAEYVTVASDKDGMIVENVEEALRCGVKFIYALPNFQNPTGVTLSYERRKKLVELADKYGVPIVEDDPYGQLRFEGEHIPALLGIDAEYRGCNTDCYRGNVIYLSTFSKILVPGFRLAWVIAPPEVISKMVMAKQGADLHTPTFTQYIAYEAIKNNFLDGHVKKIRKVYHERRDVMLDTLAEHMPEGVSWTHPEGGLFLWLETPDYMDTVEILKESVDKERVAFVPGAPFHPNGGGHNTMRFNFSYCAPEKINEGISRLGRVVKSQIRK